MDINPPLGERLRRLREARRMTQRDVADCLGVTTKTVGNWERGDRLPRNSIGALEQLFSVSLDDGEPLDLDEVIAAIERSALTRGNKHRLSGLYFEMLDSQQQTG